MDAPAADVAKEYAFELNYFPIQGSTASAYPVTGSVLRSDVLRVQQGAR